jgi:hypothetical protein
VCAAESKDPVAITMRFSILLVGVLLGTVLGVDFLTGSHTALVSLALGGVLIFICGRRPAFGATACSGAIRKLALARDRRRDWRRQRRNRRLRHALARELVTAETIGVVSADMHRGGSDDTCIARRAAGS